MDINWIKNIDNLEFFEYLPVHNVVWRTCTKINWILN